MCLYYSKWLNCNKNKAPISCGITSNIQKLQVQSRGLQTLGRNCSISPNVSYMTLRVGFVRDQRHSILPPESSSVTGGGLFFILIRLLFHLVFISFSLPIFIRHNVFAADWQKSLLLSLLLWASRRGRTTAECGSFKADWEILEVETRAAIGYFVSTLDTFAQVSHLLLASFTAIIHADY